jgi:hypothetical protein
VEILTRPSGLPDAPLDIETIDRDEFLEEFHGRQEPGQHTIFVGPTGRGKSTLMCDCLLMGPPTRHVGILTPKGHDRAFEPLNAWKVRTWPGSVKRAIDKFEQPTPWTWQLSSSPKAGPGPLHDLYLNPLIFARGEPDWTWVVPDLQAMTDARFANLGKELEWNVLTLRAAGSSIWMDAQAPRWIPRASADQVSNVVIFKNSDLGTVDRLRETVSLPMSQILPLMSDLRADGHDFLWFDSWRDDLFFVIGDR